MSPKDLKTIHFMNKMIDAGVRVFKIEGRARGPEYVREAVSCYNEAINACIDGTFDEEKIAAWDMRLEKIFNRGFWNGYYLGQRLGRVDIEVWIFGNSREGICSQGGEVFFQYTGCRIPYGSGELKVGDEVIIIGPTTGAIPMTVEEIRVDLKPVPKAVKGDRFSIRSMKKFAPATRCTCGRM